jgi:hypothetical protein
MPLPAISETDCDKEMALTIDTSGAGLSMVLKDYQEEALRYIWSLSGDGASSRDVWNNVNKSLQGFKTISRASIINFLNSMVEAGVLTFSEITGKGGHRRIYYAKLDEIGFKKFIAETVIKNLMRDWPEETKEVIARI